MATDARGHTVPTGSDFAQRQSLTDLSLSIGEIVARSSEAAANLLLSELASAGITPSATKPIYVERTDTAALMRNDGSGWRPVTQGLYIATSSSVYMVTASNGSFNLDFGVTFASPPIVVTMDGGQGSAAEYYKAGSAATTTRIQLLARKNGAAVTGACRVNWFAIGKLA